MELKNYETVFILTPVLSEQQTKDAVEKFKNLFFDLFLGHHTGGSMIASLHGRRHGGF